MGRHKHLKSLDPRDLTFVVLNSVFWVFMIGLQFVTISESDGALVNFLIDVSIFELAALLYIPLHFSLMRNRRVEPARKSIEVMLISSTTLAKLSFLLTASIAYFVLMGMWGETPALLLVAFLIVLLYIVLDVISVIILRRRAGGYRREFMIRLLFVESCVVFLPIASFTLMAMVGRRFENFGEYAPFLLLLYVIIIMPSLLVLGMMALLGKLSVPLPDDARAQILSMDVVEEQASGESKLSADVTEDRMGNEREACEVKGACPKIDKVFAMDARGFCANANFCRREPESVRAVVTGMVGDVVLSSYESDIERIEA